MEKTINEINDEEQVARILFSPSHIYEGRVSPKAFFLSLDGRVQTAKDISPDIDYFQKELSILCDGIHKFR